MNDQDFEFRFQDQQEQRLDRFLTESVKDVSRARLQGLIREGGVHVNGRPAGKTGQMIGPGDVIRLHIPATVPARLIPEAIALDIVYENSDVLIVNKPAGMVVHPAAGHDVGTLANAALGHDPGLAGVGGEARPGVVHRLDKDTSGLIILAKNDMALHWLQDEFKSRNVAKTYLALVDGTPRPASGRIESSIGRDPNHRKQMANLPAGRGRQAVSEYRTLENFGRHTLLEFHPLTGRTHQIRLHCALLGCPIVGDQIYGRKVPSVAIGRHCLHAQRLVLRLPGEITARAFEAPVPADLLRVFERVREGSIEVSRASKKKKSTWTL